MVVEEYTRMSTKHMYTCVHTASSVIKQIYLSMPGTMKDLPETSLLKNFSFIAKSKMTAAAAITENLRNRP